MRHTQLPISILAPFISCAISQIFFENTVTKTAHSLYFMEISVAICLMTSLTLCFFASIGLSKDLLLCRRLFTIFPTFFLFGSNFISFPLFLRRSNTLLHLAIFTMIVPGKNAPRYLLILEGNWVLLESLFVASSVVLHFHHKKQIQSDQWFQKPELRSIPENKRAYKAIRYL